MKKYWRNSESLTFLALWLSFTASGSQLPVFLASWLDLQFFQIWSCISTLSMKFMSSSLLMVFITLQYVLYHLFHWMWLYQQICISCICCTILVFNSYDFSYSFTPYSGKSRHTFSRIPFQLWAIYIFLFSIDLSDLYLMLYS